MIARPSDMRRDSEPCQDEGGDSLPQPFHSTRSDVQGSRGCWAVSGKTGEPCAAPAVRGEPFCAAHSGLGISADPAKYAPIGQKAHRERLAVRATMRAMYGGTRPNSPRAVLRAHVEAQAIALVGSTVGAALDESADPLKRGHLALKLIEAADPRDQATLTVSTAADVQAMSLAELLAFAQQHGIEYEKPSSTPPAALPAGS